MKLYSKNDNYKLYQGNMLDMLEVIEPNSIDSIITDPPYELNFMGKGWDNSGIAFQRGETLRKNTHPTVKPTELMQYLVRLVSPDGATILDPFNGSGSTGKAVMYENRERNKNYKYIGIELTEEYLPIAKARIEYVCNLEPEKDLQMTIFDFIEVQDDSNNNI